MPRPRLRLGEHGNIEARQLPNGQWVASCWIRDPDGKRRRVRKYTPKGERSSKTAAKTLLSDYLAVRQIYGESDHINGKSTVSDLWDEYRAQLVEKERASNTLRDYDRQIVSILERFGQVPIPEVTTQAVDLFIRDVAATRGVPTAKKVRTIISGMFKIAVQFQATEVNPIREISDISGKRKKRAKSLDAQSLAALLHDLRTSKLPCPVILAPYQIARGQKTTDKDVPTVADFCRKNGMVDIITMFAATGCRIGELLAIRWQDINLETKTVAVTGQIVRIRGEGLVRQDLTKSEAGDDRDLPLPEFAMTMLRGRSQDSVYVFESLAGTILDPETVGRRWRQIRAALDLEWVTSHTFRKSVATILDEEGLTARQAADQLGHAQVSMTQDVYFGRGKVHTAAADALDAAVSGKKPGRESGT